MKMSNAITVKALGGKIWTVVTTPDVPKGFIAWNSNAYKTEGIALGAIKRIAKANGGDAAFAIVPDIYQSGKRQTYSIYVGTSEEMEALFE